MCGSARGRALRAAPKTGRRGSPRPSCRPRRAGTAGSTTWPCASTGRSCPAWSQYRCAGGRGSPPHRARRRARSARSRGRSPSRSTCRVRSCRRRPGRPGTGSARSACWRAAARRDNDDPLLDLLQAEVIVVEDLLGKLEVLLDLGALGPRYRQEPVEVVAHHSGFRRHRRHLPELLELVSGLLARLLRELGLLDLVLDFGELVLAFRVVDLFLDRLHLLVEKNLALGLLHLPLDAGADALLHLQHRNLAVDQAEHLLQPLGDRRG